MQTVYSAPLYIVYIYIFTTEEATVCFTHLPLIIVIIIALYGARTKWDISRSSSRNQVFDFFRILVTNLRMNLLSVIFIISICKQTQTHIHC